MSLALPYATELLFPKLCLSLISYSCLFLDTIMVSFSKHLLFLKSFRNVLKDYVDAFRSFRNSFRDFPVKYSVLSSTFIIFLFVSYHCPDNVSYSNIIISSTNEISLVSSKLRNIDTEGKLFALMQLNDEAKICTFSLGLCRIAYMLKTTPNTNLYSIRSYLLTPFNIYSYMRILDVGFMNTWWYIKRTMVNFDVNNV